MKIGTVAVIIVVAAFLLPLAILWTALRYGMNSASTVDAAALASIMAAVFTVGALVLGLVSFYTMARINEATREAVDFALSKVDTKIDDSIQNFLEAYSSFTSAREEWESRGVESLAFVESEVAQAEQANPSLRGMNTWMAEVYFVAAQTAYFRSIGYDTIHQVPQPLELSAAKGIERFKTALEADDSTMDTTYAVELAELYALIGERPAEVTHWIAKAKTFGLLPSMNAEIALTLFSSCKRHADLLQLMDAYGAVPMTGEEVLAFFRSNGGSFAQLIAFADAPGGLQHHPVNPFVLNARSVDSFSSATADWRAREQPHYTELRGGLPRLGEYDTPRGYQERPAFESMETLLPSLMSNFTFIVPLRAG